MEVKVRLSEEARVQASVRAGLSGRSFSQFVRDAVDFYIAADRDGVTRVGSYWAVPEERAALTRKLPGIG
jgi:hypothetical protein